MSDIKQVNQNTGFFSPVSPRRHSSRRVFPNVVANHPDIEGMHRVLCRSIL